MQQSGETIVAFQAPRLGINPVLFVALSAEFLSHGPWPRPHSRIFYRDLVGEGLWPGARPALDEMQILARSEYIGLRTEIGHVDHEGVAFPMTARVAEPLTDVGRQVRTAAHHDVTLPPLTLTHVIENRDAARGLHDLAETAGGAAEFRQPRGQAALRP